MIYGDGDSNWLLWLMMVDVGGSWWWLMGIMIDCADRCRWLMVTVGGDSLWWWCWSLLMIMMIDVYDDWWWLWLMYKMVAFLLSPEWTERVHKDLQCKWTAIFLLSVRYCKILCTCWLSGRTKKTRVWSTGFQKTPAQPSKWAVQKKTYIQISSHFGKFP